MTTQAKLTHHSNAVEYGEGIGIRLWFGPHLLAPGLQPKIRALDDGIPTQTQARIGVSGARQTARQCAWRSASAGVREPD